MGQSYSEQHYDEQSSPMVKSFRLITVHSDKLRAVWKWRRPNAVHEEVRSIKIFYQYGDHIEHSTQQEQIIEEKTLTKLHANTRYRVCIAINGLLNGTSLTREEHCLSTNTTVWHTPASIGSSIGAFLALSLIIIMVLISQRTQRRRRLLRGTNTASSKRSRFDSTFESQFDSIAIREETTFYEGDEESSCMPDASELGDSITPNHRSSTSLSILTPNGGDMELAYSCSLNNSNAASSMQHMETTPFLSRESRTVKFKGDKVVVASQLIDNMENAAHAVEECCISDHSALPNSPMICPESDNEVATSESQLKEDATLLKGAHKEEGHCDENASLSSASFGCVENKIVHKSNGSSKGRRTTASTKQVIQVNDTDHYTIDLMRYKPAPEPLPSPNDPPSPPPPPPPPPPQACTMLKNSDNLEQNIDNKNLCGRYGVPVDSSEMPNEHHNPQSVYTQLIETL